MPNRLRYVPLTVRLGEALREHRHLSSTMVLCLPGGKSLTRKTVQSWMRRVCRRAGIAKNGVHVLRHTFCSHLAMRRAPARAIQELAERWTPSFGQVFVTAKVESGS